MCIRDSNMANGIYIQAEYRGKLIRKIVCNGEERWFIGSDSDGIRFGGIAAGLPIRYNGGSLSLIHISLYPLITYYLNRLNDWGLCFRQCKVCLLYTSCAQFAVHFPRPVCA